jgi:hypothetical protein
VIKYFAIIYNTPNREKMQYKYQKKPQKMRKNFSRTQKNAGFTAKNQKFFQKAVYKTDFIVYNGSIKAKAVNGRMPLWAGFRETRRDISRGVSACRNARQ